MVLVLAVVLAGVCGTSGCGDHGAPSSDGTPTATPNATPTDAAHGPLTIFASNAALAYFAQRIGDASVRIEVPPEEGIDPAFWKPTAAEIGRMQAADVVLLNGAGYEHWRSQVALVERHVVETAESFRGEWIEEPGGVTHSHGLQGAHSHAGTAFTTWMDPTLAIEQAKAIHARLAELLPAQAEDLRSRYQGLERDLRSLVGQYESAVGNSNSLPILFSHPVYQYFIRRFDLNARVVHWEPGEVPSDAELDALAGILAEHPAKWMVWEDEPGAATRAKLRERGVECVVVAPAANMGTGWARWLERQTENAAQFAKVFE